MTMRTLHRWSLTMAAGLPIAGVMSGSSLLAFSGALMLLVLVLRGGNLFDIPRSKTQSALVHGATVALLLFAIATFPKSRIDAVLIVVMLGIFNRWILRGGHRDDLIILGASSVLLAAATTITPGAAFALIITGFVIFALWSMFAAVVLSLAERETSEEARRAAWQRLGRRPVGGMLGKMAWMSILFTLMGSALMLFFPRYHFVRFLAVGAFMNLAGTTDSMELRTSGVPGPGGGWLAMRVEPSPGRSEQTVEGLYALMGVLDQFDGRTWRTRLENPTRELYLYPPGQLYRGPKELFTTDKDGPNTMRVTMFRRSHRAQVHPIATLGRDRPGYVGMYSVRQLENGNIVGSAPGNSVHLVYKIDPDRQYTNMPVPDWEERFLQLPSDLDPRVVDLAQQLTEGRTTDREKVNAVLAHFNTGRFQYSLDPLDGESSDPLVRFLLEARRGHCELYAGAVAVLLRLAGVKARVATGYYGGWWNSLGGYLELGDVDAHAWVEAYYDDAWHWVDATPESRRSRREDRFFAGIYDAYDAVEAFWHSYVVSFDENERRQMVGRMAATWKSTSADWLGGGDSRGTSSGGSASWLALPLLLGGIITGIIVLIRRRNRRADVLGLRLRRALGGRSEGTLGRLLNGVAPEAQPAARDAIRAYERMRFGPAEQAPRPREVELAILALERSRRAIRSPGSRRSVPGI